MGHKGFTLLEVILSVVIVSFLGLALGRVVRGLMRSQVSSLARAELQAGVFQVQSRMRLALEKAGDGVANCETGDKSIFADYAPLSQDQPWIVFFSRDVDGSGQNAAGFADDMNVGDEWTRYRLVDGRILEDTFTNAAAWTDLVPGSVGELSPSGTRVLALPHGVKVAKLEFNYYRADSVNPATPSQRVNDGFAASWVRVRLELERSGVAVQKDFWAFLRNVSRAISC